MSRSPARRAAARRGRLAAVALACLLASAGHAARADGGEGGGSGEGGDALVRGDRRAPPERTAASQRLEGRDLAQPGGSVAAALRAAPGVQTTRAGSAAELTTLQVRGAAGAETDVYLGGVRLNDELTGIADLSLVSLFSLAHVDLHRGSAPLGYPVPLGGALFLEPAWPRGAEGGVTLGLGSFGEQSLALRAGAGSAGSAQAVVGVRFAGADNDYEYLDDRGTRFVADDDRMLSRENADFESFELWAMGRIRAASNVRVELVAHGFEREQGVTGLSVIPARAARGESRRLLATALAVLPCPRSLSSAGCETRLGVSWLHTSLALRDPLRELGLGALRADSRAERFAPSAELRVPLGPEGRLLGRLGATVDRLMVTGSGSPGARRLAVGPALGAEWVPVGNLLLSLSGSLRASRTEERASESRVLPSGRLGLRWPARGALALRAGVARSLREPSLGELYGTSVIVRGNDALRPEHGIQGDLGVDAESELPGGAVTAAVTAFLHEAEDLIAYRRSGFLIRPYNVATARLSGLELSLRARWLERVTADVAVTLLDPRDTTALRQTVNDVLPFRARLVATGALGYEAPVTGGGLLAGWGVGVGGAHRSSRYADPAGLIVVPESTDLTLQGSLALKGGVAAKGAVENVLDERVFDTVGLPLPGRAFHLEVSKTW